ncbi:MAG: methyltransferase domain-containing protein [Chloroflexota bacterium]|nr:methyltransferase domain-containing protein [Chloroflexota bacterium]
MTAVTSERPHNHEDSHGHGKGGHVQSSFWMHDPERVFAALGLRQGDAFPDLGCGPGDYAIEASRIVGDSGAVYALDRSEEAIERLTEEAGSQGVGNIKPVVSDITRPLPIDDACIDVCLMATVLHVPDVVRSEDGVLEEIRRVLKPCGRVAIIECKKKDMPIGPPLSMRLSPQEVEALMTPHGLERTGAVDLGYNYMVQFRVARGSSRRSKNRVPGPRTTDCETCT